MFKPPSPIYMEVPISCNVILKTKFSGTEITHGLYGNLKIKCPLFTFCLGKPVRENQNYMCFTDIELAGTRISRHQSPTLVISRSLLLVIVTVSAAVNFDGSSIPDLWKFMTSLLQDLQLFTQWYPVDSVKLGQESIILCLTREFPAAIG